MVVSNRPAIVDGWMACGLSNPLFYVSDADNKDLMTVSDAMSTL